MDGDILRPDNLSEYTFDDFSFLDNNNGDILPFQSELADDIWNIDELPTNITGVSTLITSNMIPSPYDREGASLGDHMSLATTNTAPGVPLLSAPGPTDGLNLEEWTAPEGAHSSVLMNTANPTVFGASNTLGLSLTGHGTDAVHEYNPMSASHELATPEPENAQGTTWEWEECHDGSLRRRRVKTCDLCGTKIPLGAGTKLTSFINHRASKACNKAAKARNVPRSQSLVSSASSSPPTPIRSITSSPLELPPILGVENMATAVGTATQEGTQQDLCPGTTMRFQGSVYVMYPWQMHHYHKMPYIIVSIGTDCLHLRIRSINCATVTAPNATTCRPCAYLDGNKELLALIERTTQQPNAATNYSYLNFTQLTSLLATKNTTINEMKLESLNRTRKIATLLNSVDEHSQFVSAIATKDVPALSRLIRVAVKQQVSIPEIIQRIKAAGESLYHVKSFSIREHDIAALALRTGGPRLGNALKMGLGLPGLSTTYQKMNCPQIRLSIYAPNLLDISMNISSAFRPIQATLESLDLPGTTSQPKRLWSVLIDEVAIERRPRYDYSSDSIAGICREHSGRIDLTSVSARGLDGIRLVQAALASGQCHRAKEATVIAIAGFGKDPYVYGARIVAVSPTCKTESEDDGYKVLLCLVEAWKTSAQGKIVHGPLSSFETDGDPVRRRIFHRFCMKEKLPETSPLHPIIGSLPLFNSFCGPNQITHGGDFKHEEKRFATALRSKEGILVAGTLINSGQIKLLLSALPDETPATVAPLFDVTDHQNVPNANRLLNLIYHASQLPHIILAPEHRSFVILGKLLNSFTQPFTNPELSLSQQLIHLSTCAHLLFALYCLNTGSFIPGQLYYDMQTTIKTAYFTVAKSQIIDPESPVYLLQGGTDRLEQRFSTMHTMTHDRNMDAVQLIDRAEAAQHIDEIYARNPDLYQGSYRLSLDGNTGIDHTNPVSWKGNVIASSAGIRSCWSTGLERAAQILTRGNATFCFDEVQLQQALLSTGSISNKIIDMMQPFGTYVGINADTVSMDPPVDIGSGQSTLLHATINQEPVDIVPPLSEEDLSIEDLLPPPHLGEHNSSTEPASGKKAWITVDGKLVHAESLIRCCLGFDEGAKSTDRLRRVIGLTRSPFKPSLTKNCILGTDFLLGQLVLSFVRIDAAPAAAILKVTSITLGDGTSVEGISPDNFQDITIKLGGQILALNFNADTGFWIWNLLCPWEVLQTTTRINSSKSTSSTLQSISSKASSVIHFPAILAVPINPSAHTQSSGIWAFEDKPLNLLISQHWGNIASSTSTLNLIPVRVATASFPYRDISGKKCFLQDEGQSLSTNANPEGLWPCYLCLKEFKVKDMRKHVSSHLLARQLNVNDPNLMLPDGDFSCGYCGVKDTCTIELQKPQRTYIPSSSCPYYIKFSLVSAEKSTDANPSTNRPILCEICHSRNSSKQPSNAHVFWSYTMEAHIQNAHQDVTLVNLEFRKKFTISDEERQRLGVAGLEITPIRRIQPRQSKAKANAPVDTPAPAVESAENIPGPSSGPVTETGAQPVRTKRARATTNTMETQPGTSKAGSSKRSRAVQPDK